MLSERQDKWKWIKDNPSFYRKHEWRHHAERSCHTATFLEEPPSWMLFQHCKLWVHVQFSVPQVSHSACRVVLCDPETRSLFHYVCVYDTQNFCILLCISIFPGEVKCIMKRLLQKHALCNKLWRQTWVAQRSFTHLKQSIRSLQRLAMQDRLVFPLIYLAFERWV